MPFAERRARWLSHAVQGSAYSILMYDRGNPQRRIAVIFAAVLLHGGFEHYDYVMDRIARQIVVRHLSLKRPAGALRTTLASSVCAATSALLATRWVDAYGGGEETRVTYQVGYGLSLTAAAGYGFIVLLTSVVYVGLYKCGLR